MFHIHNRLILLLLVPALLFGAAETVRPSGWNDATNFAEPTPTSNWHNRWQDDTDTSDGLWVCVVATQCSADTSNSTSNTAVDIDVEMNDPTNDPTTVTNDQQVCVRIRKTTPSTGPTFTVDILEGNTVRVNDVISQALSGTDEGDGTEFCANWTFDTAAWTDDTGAAIEVGVDCPAPGGSPGNRATCELGSVELNLTTQDASSGPFIIFTGMLNLFRGFF